jgi:hypothetical protein
MERLVPPKRKRKKGKKTNGNGITVCGGEVVGIELWLVRRRELGRTS